MEDDKGRVHTLDIKGALYVPKLMLSVLFHQHWAQQAKDNPHTLRRTYMANVDDKCVLYCNQRWYKHSVSCDIRTNTRRF